MIVARSFEADQINGIVNHPAVLPLITLPGQHDLDLTEVVADRSNVLLMANGGGFIFQPHEPGIYEIHTNFLPSARGSYALRALRDAMAWMFFKTDCMEILTKVPVSNRPAMAFARAAGATLDFTRKNAWPTHDGGAADIHYYAMRYHDWVRQAPGLADRGHWFHERLEAEKKRLGASSPIHEDEPCHDRHVGACVGMIFGGQVGKAVILYNRWARFSGYLPISLTKRDPVVIDIQEALIEVRGEDFEVTECR